MQACFNHVQVDAIVGLASSLRIDVRETAIKHGINEKRLNRFVKTNGFEKLSVIQPPFCLGDVCVNCCNKIFNELDVDPKTVDAFIVSSQTHDYIIPGTSFSLQEKLGLSNDCLMFDMIQGCPGYVNSLFHASMLIESKICKKVLICCGEISNHNIPPSVTNIESFLEAGDGCGATLLSYSESTSPIYFSLKTYGEKYRVVMDGSYGNRASRVADEITKQSFTILGNEMNVFVLDTVKKHIIEFLSNNNMSFDDIELCFSQQTSFTLVKALNAVLGAPNNWIPFLSAEFGNLSSASIPSFISNNLSKKQDATNKPYLLAAFGVGLASSLCILNLNQTKILPLILFN